MANSGGIPTTLSSRDLHCKVCDLYLDTVESLEVHLQYHKENLYMKWGTQNTQNENDNNINGSKLKNDTTVSAPADSSDNIMITKPSPEFQQRATPETSAQFPHPATPQSYHSAPSPYQNTDQTNFSPGAQFGNNYTHSAFPQNQHSTDQINWEPSQYNQEQYHKPNRFHPYTMQERVSQVSSSSPLYGQAINQPTPSPSPNQCDKCGFVCDSAMQLNEHCSSAHASSSTTSAAANLPFQQFASKQYSNSGYQNEATKVKEEQEESSDILDLDSQKVVYQGNEGEPQNAAFEQPTSQAREVNSRTVPMMPWEAQKMYSNAQLNGDVSLFKDQKMFAEQKSYPPDAKMFHPEQKFAYTPDKFLNVHHDQKSFMHVEQKIYPGVQMPPMTDYSASVGSANPDMKPPYRPYDSPTAPQISSSQPANQASSTLPSIGKGANWKSNEARRPKTYNCTACNKWFTSSGHLKRHYNTTLHKNAVRSSGQPDPATLPISSHHHPTRESLQARAQQQAADSNTQSPIPSEDGRSVDDASLQSPYPSQGFERSHRMASMQTKSPYTHLQQGNLDNSFSNNPLANHPLQHQIGSQPLNIGSQPPGVILGSTDSNHQGSKNVPLTTASNPPNGEAGPSASQNHHMRGLLSVSTNNIAAPATTQTSVLTAHTLPPFSHLGVNPYSQRSTEPLGPSIADPTHTPLYLGQNFQQTIAPSYPNGMAPHVTDMAISNLPIASQATFGEQMPEVDDVMEQEASNEPTGGRLPCFAQLQSQPFGVYVSNYYLTSPNVGGQVVADDTSANYVVINPIQTIKIEIDAQNENENAYNFSTMDFKENNYFDQERVNNYPYDYAVEGKTMKQISDDGLNSGELQVLKIETIMDTNKENYIQMPASPESARSDRYSPERSTPVTTSPLTESNKLKKPGQSPFTVVHKCFQCDKIFNKGCYLTQHNKTFHSGAKPFRCERCGKRFPDGETQKKHSAKHAHDKPFKCMLCPKAFNHKTDLRRHMCLHTGSKPYACDSCGKGFIRKDHMLKHLEIHKKKNRAANSSRSSSSSLSS